MTGRKKGKGRRTDQDIFLDTLKKLGGDERSPVGNKNLREKLGWESGKYNKFKDRLLDRNLILRARGRGGAVSLPPPLEDNGLTVFVSYSHKDKLLKDLLMSHLKPLERLNLIKTWHDKEIKPGTEWRKSISEKLKNADLILLLVSIDFINSDFCYTTELDQAMERHDAEEARVIPIILRDCLWNHAPFADLKILPVDFKSVTHSPNLDSAMRDIAKVVESVAKDIRLNK